MNLRLLGGLAATALALLWSVAVPAASPSRAAFPPRSVACDAHHLPDENGMPALSSADAPAPSQGTPSAEDRRFPKLTTVLRTLAAESHASTPEGAAPAEPPVIEAETVADPGEALDESAFAGAGVQRESRDEISLEEEVRFRDYVIRVWFRSSDDAGDDRLLEIERAGEQLYLQCALSYFHVLRQPPGDGDENSVERREPAAWVGKDVTGEGEPDLVVVREDGGSNSPSVIHVFELGRAFKKVVIIEAYQWHFEDLDGDEIPELTAVDNYGYWPCKHAIEPRVVFRFRDGAYRPAPDLMRRPASDFVDWRAVAKRVLEESDWESEVPPSGRPPAELCGYVADLVYAGQAELAQEFLDAAWPDSIPGKGEAVLDLARAIAGSEFWDTVIAVNTW